MTNNYNKVREAIIKVVPEIMELKFGCNIVTTWEHSMIITGKSYNGWYVVGFAGQIMTDTTIKDSSIKQIIGRDITLEDVLQATKNGIQLSIQNNGCWMLFDVSEDNESFDWWEKRNVNWAMGRPLHEQSEETINFLSEIL